MATIAIKKKKKKITMDDVELLLLTIPTTLWYLLFSYIPMFGVIVAFKTFRPVPGANFIVSLFSSEWCGLKNFDFLFATNETFIMFRNSILYNLVLIVLGMVVPCTLAILITNLYSKKLAKICQTFMFLPNFLSMTVVSYFVFAFLSFDKGLVNKTLESFGQEAIDFYNTPSFWPVFLVLLSVWKGAGYGMVLYMATITGIDGTLYEAAVIDGATKWQQTKSITLPMLRPIMAILLIMSIGGIFGGDFGLFYVVPKNQQALYEVTLVIPVFIYNALMKTNNIGFSSAASLFQSVLGLIMITSANYAVKRIDSDLSFF